jgi:fructose-bisphosphate aldolase class II
METLRTAMERAQSERVAIAHFNVSDFLLAKAVVSAARETGKTIVIGVSEGEREFIGVKQIAALVRAFREELETPLFLNADHTHSLQGAIEAAKAGFDSVVFDMSALPFAENIRQTRDAVRALKAINPDFVVEGEIGDIGTGSAIRNLETASEQSLTKPEEARDFVRETGIDVLAPAVGNRHGMSPDMAKGTAKKRLKLERIAEIKAATGALLTLHGGSGTNDEDLQAAISAGINLIHINTELRVAWRRGLEKGLAEMPDEVVPYKILPWPLRAIKEVAVSRISLFDEIKGRHSAGNPGSAGR